MSMIKKKIVVILIMMVVIIMGTLNTYAASEKEELMSMLDEYKEEMGDLKEFKAVIDKLYNDINSQNEVTDELKEKLQADVDELTKLSGMNALLKNVLEVELRSQIENLNNENLSGVKEEIAVIKEWADKQVSEMENQQNINNPDSTQDNSNKDGTLANTPLPQAGSMTGIILVVLAVTIIGTIITAIQYRKIK